MRSFKSPRARRRMLVLAVVTPVLAVAVGVVVQGAFQPDGGFEASEVLAKHDETYMPREVAESLKRQGRWREGEVAPNS